MHCAWGWVSCTPQQCHAARPHPTSSPWSVCPFPRLQTLSPSPPQLCAFAVSSLFHPDLSHRPVDQPQPILSPEPASPHAPFPLSWAWMPLTAQSGSSSLHPHGGCRRCWRTCWTHRKFCRTWTSSRPWPCCCPRAPAPAGLLGPQLAALAGRPTARGPAWAWAPIPPWRKVPRLLRPRPPQTCCRASVRPLYNSGPPCNPSCVATTGRWQAGKLVGGNEAGGAGPDPEAWRAGTLKSSPTTRPPAPEAALPPLRPRPHTTPTAESPALSLTARPHPAPLSQRRCGEAT